MKSFGIIILAIVATIALFGVAITIGNIVYRTLCWVYNKVKQ